MRPLWVAGRPPPRRPTRPEPVIKIGDAQTRHSPTTLSALSCRSARSAERCAGLTSNGKRCYQNSHLVRRLFVADSTGQNAPEGKQERTCSVLVDRILKGPPSSFSAARSVQWGLVWPRPRSKPPS